MPWMIGKSSKALLLVKVGVWVKTLDFKNYHRSNFCHKLSSITLLGMSPTLVRCFPQWKKSFFDLIVRWFRCTLLTRVYIHPRWWSPDFWTINSIIIHPYAFSKIFLRISRGSSYLRSGLVVRLHWTSQEWWIWLDYMRFQKKPVRRPEPQRL